MRHHGLPLNGERFPPLPEEVDIDYEYDLQIPGDLMQRIGAARMANPEWRLSQTTLINQLFPEIKSAVVEQGNLRAEDALRNPLMAQVMLINEVQKAAIEARHNRDDALAGHLSRVAIILEQQMQGMGAPQAQQGRGNDGLPSNALPPEVQEMLLGAQA